MSTSTHPVALPSPRVLLLDDDTLVLRALRRAVGASAQVFSHHDPADALRDAATQDAFDLVVFDMHMGSVDGPEFFARLMVLRPELRARCVVMSGDTESDVLVAFARQEGLRTLRKPFLGRELLALVTPR